MRRLAPSCRHLAIGVLLAIASANVGATIPDPADSAVQQFLARDDTQHPYHATRRLDAENGGRRGWLEVATEYSPSAGFHYTVTAEGGSSLIRGKVLRPVLEGERDVIARGETARSSLAPANYTFQPNGVDADGLANVLLSPRRKERILVSGSMSLQASDGGLVRLQGRLAKSPSFWIKNVDIVRTYTSIDGTVVPIALESTAHVRFLGPALLRMTYVYSEIDGRKVTPLQQDGIAGCGAGSAVAPACP
jgi:hypothetical protein